MSALSRTTGSWLIARHLPFALLLVVACGSPKLTTSGAAGEGARADGGTEPGRDGPGFTVGESSDGGAAPVGGSAPRPPGSGEQCAEEAIRGELLPLDLMLVLDASGSMDRAVAGKTPWQRVSEALVSFAQDPRSTGLGIGFRTFPITITHKPCATDADCADFHMGCGRPFLCVGPAVTPAMASSCDPNDAFCPAGTRCTPSGQCSVSGGRCVNLGQPCPGGPAGDVCGPAPLACKMPVESCIPADYQRPDVPIAPLPAAAPALTQGLVGVSPGGNTPIATAFEGATRYLRQHLATQPGRRAALVLATDAAPSACGNATTEAVVAAIEAARTGTPALQTYVIGAVGAGDTIRTMDANRFAEAGGTTRALFVNEAAPDLRDTFLAALDAVRGSALPCEFRIPRPSAGTLDYNKVNVRFIGAGGPDDLVYVASADRCDPMKGGWYYDVDPLAGTPSTVRVCEATCNRFKAEAGGTVELRFGCRTRID
jgi:hypothetical protein